MTSDGARLLVRFPGGGPCAEPRRSRVGTFVADGTARLERKLLLAATATKDDGMAKRPDFFMSAAGEMTGDFAAVRACWIRGRVRDDVHDGHMLVEIDPPVIGQKYGLGGRDITAVILSPRFHESPLSPVVEWPGHVYVSRILDQSVIESLAISKGQVELIAWAMIFPTIEEAQAWQSGPPRRAP